jgi:hypothetical protein
MAMAQLLPQLGLQDAGALWGIGSQQQALNQQNLSQVYEDFVNQQEARLGALDQTGEAALTLEAVSNNGIFVMNVRINEAYTILIYKREHIYLECLSLIIFKD